MLFHPGQTGPSERALKQSPCGPAALRSVLSIRTSKLFKAFRFKARAMASVTLASCSAATQTQGPGGPGPGSGRATWRLPGLSGPPRPALRAKGPRPARSRSRGSLARSACRELSLNICDSFISHSWMSSRIFAPDCEQRGDSKASFHWNPCNVHLCLQGPGAAET